jgi:radical SAM superfamily enzyme YgiQ (UPF0313 family)
VELVWPGGDGIALANLGYQVVARTLQAIPGVRFAVGTPPRRQASRSLDWLAVSLSYENDYPAALGMIRDRGIPMEAATRDDRDPLVIVGGIAPSLNPEPLADFADLFVIGEAEEALPELVDAWRSARAGSLGRAEMLAALARVEGTYVPRFYRPKVAGDGTFLGFTTSGGVPTRVRRRFVRNLDPFRADGERPTEDAGFTDMILVEVGRGCARGCRFCAAGSFYRPIRHRGLEALLPVIERRIAEGRRIGLLGASVFDHPGLPELARFLGLRGAPFSVSSLRADALDPEVLGLMARGGLKTVTIAPETGTERLRWVIGKRITDDQVLGAARMVAEAGIPNLKLYFMIGLPGERTEDVDGIAGLVAGVRAEMLAVARGLGRIGTVGVSVSCFVPKAHTPFQWHPMEGVATLKKKQRRLQSALGRMPNVRATFDVPRQAYVQALLSRGDRGVGAVLRVAAATGDWKTALRASPVDPDLTVLRARGEREPFPWEVVDPGIRRAALWREYQAAIGAAGE